MLCFAFSRIKRQLEERSIIKFESPTTSVETGVALLSKYLIETSIGTADVWLTASIGGVGVTMLSIRRFEGAVPLVFGVYGAALLLRFTAVIIPIVCVRCAWAYHKKKLRILQI